MTTDHQSIYRVHPGVAHAQAVINNLVHKTGRTLDQWGKRVIDHGPEASQQRVAWLKAEHQLGTVTAAMIVDHLEGRGQEKTDPVAYLKMAPVLVDSMYAGKKLALRPLHDKLIAVASALPGVGISPGKSIVPIYRFHVIAQIKPATQKRIDFGLALGAEQHPFSQRLVSTSGAAKGDRITHTIAIREASDIDDELVAALTLAHSLDTP